MNLYAAQHEGASSYLQESGGLAPLLAITCKRETSDGMVNRPVNVHPFGVLLRSPAGRIVSSAFSTTKLSVRAIVVRICLQEPRNVRRGEESRGG